MKLRERLESIKKYLKPAEGGLFIPPDIEFIDHTKWSKTMLEQMSQNIGMADMMKPTKEEPIDVMTKALIVQHLGDIMTRHPDVSIRRIMSDVFADGVKDDYELLDKLIALDKEGFKKTKGEKIVIRTGRNPTRDDRQDAMTYMMRGMLDNLHMANNPQMIAKPGPSAGCSDPADKTGSASAK